MGPDYGSPSHIIRANSYWRRRRCTRALPQRLVMFTLGFVDEDFDCFDLDSFDSESGEYAMEYWSPGLTEQGVRALDFREYIARHLEHWESARPPKRNKTAPLNDDTGWNDWIDGLRNSLKHS